MTKPLKDGRKLKKAVYDNIAIILFSAFFNVFSEFYRLFRILSSFPHVIPFSAFYPFSVSYSKFHHSVSSTVFWQSFISAVAPCDLLFHYIDHVSRLLAPSNTEIQQLLASFSF
jgi:glycosyltransferase involved in cell wall biosynthesis